MTREQSSLLSSQPFLFFTTVVEIVAPQVQEVGKLTLKGEFLMKLQLTKPWLRLLNEDLGYKFGVSVSTVSRMFHKWLEVMYITLQLCIRWSDKETVRITLLTAFKKHYSKVCCIIDCSEIFIEHPSSLQARAETFSNYKKHNTVKFFNRNYSIRNHFLCIKVLGLKSVW